MDFLERNPLPEKCQHCTDVECDICDIGLDRWYIPHDLDLRIQKKSLLKALNRERQQNNETLWIEDRIKEIDQQLLPFSTEQIDAIEQKTNMTKKIFEECVTVCTNGQDEEMLNALCLWYPAYVG